MLDKATTTSVLVSFCPCDKIPKRNNFKREKVYFGSGFSPWTLGFVCFWALNEAKHHRRAVYGEAKMLTSWSGSSEKGEEGTRNKLCLSMAHSQ
jgi:hypothetical protein